MRNIKKNRVPSTRQISEQVMAIAVDRADSIICRYVYNTNYTDPFLMAKDVLRLHRKAVAIHQAVCELATPIDPEFPND
jgi:hypothetical protein